MKQYIKYERIHGYFNKIEIQTLLDSFIKNGQEIIFYSENPEPHSIKLTDEKNETVDDIIKYEIKVIVGKKQEIL